MLNEFFKKLAKSKKALLILDYDGTLAPLVVDRKRAFPYPGVSDRLQKLSSSKRTRLVIVTGRAISDLFPLLDILPHVEVFGSHGLEYQKPGVPYVFEEHDVASKEALFQAEELCRWYLAPDEYDIKPGSIAIHYRGKTKDEQQKIEEKMRVALQDLVEGKSLGLYPFDCGFEMRSSVIHKGTAIKRLMQGEDAIAYLGDDFTDEDAFEALGNQGLKVLVRQMSRETKADLCLKPPEELLEFLDNWIKHGF